MTPKSAAIGLFAVVAAICPLAGEKVSTDSESNYKQATDLRDQKSKARTSIYASNADKLKSLELLDKLSDQANR